MKDLELFENVRQLMIKQLEAQLTMYKMIEAVVAQQIKADGPISVHDYESEFPRRLPWKFARVGALKLPESQELKHRAAKYFKLKNRCIESISDLTAVEVK